MSETKIYRDINDEDASLLLRVGVDKSTGDAVFTTGSDGQSVTIPRPQAVSLAIFILYETQDYV